MFPKKNGENKKNHRLNEVVLSAAKLKFCPEQLQNLNYLFHKRLQAKQNALADKNLQLAKSVSERLTQRLLCYAGSLDPRFNSKFLIACDNGSSSIRSLSYILRLDCLSTPKLYPSDPIPKVAVLESDPDYPPGYARIRLRPPAHKIWNDCTNAAGYLRRDKVQAKLVELLAKATTADFPLSPLSVDESTNCGSPGKVISAAVLQRLLQVSPDGRVIFGACGENPRFPDPRDFRLAILDEPEGIRIKVEFLSPTLANIQIEVEILIGIGVDSWPSTADFPGRVPLGHSDCLLLYQSARAGMYLIGFGVQSSAWQIRLPAAHDILLDHYSTNSTVRSILDVLYDSMEEIEARRHRRKQISYKILKRYMMQTVLLRMLEESSKNPTEDLLEWSPMYLSSHVLVVLNQLILHLKEERLPNYFFKNVNLMVNPGHLCDDDYFVEANNVKGFLVRLFDESLMCTKGITEFEKILAAQESEVMLLQKWKESVDGLVPFIGKQRRVFRNKEKELTHGDYTHRQLEYLSFLLQQILEVKQNCLKEYSNTEELVLDSSDGTQIDDLIYLLVTIMDQARDTYLSKQDVTNIRNLPKIRSKFNLSTSLLVDSIKKDSALNHEIKDDLSLVRTLLKLLHHACSQDKRNISPVLKPYLNKLFFTSHTLAWHLDLIRSCESKDEINSLAMFSSLVNRGKITPAEGLIDAVNKNWSWAKSMLQMVERSSLRLIFTPERGVVHRHILSLPSYKLHKELENGSRTSSTTPRNYFSSLLSLKRVWGEYGSQHEISKRNSPMTLTLEAMDRRGDHRGWGDVLRSLQAMQKLSMFEQVTFNLPPEERGAILDLVRGLKGKRTLSRWYGRSRKSEPNCERYTPRDEGGRETKENGTKWHSGSTSTLIGSCRTARLKEDSGVFFSQDSIKIQSMLNKSESFKL